MLPKSERLRKSALIQRTYSGPKVTQPLCNIYALPRRPDSRAIFPFTAFVVGKKVSLKATRRNLVKRRMREAYRQIREDLPELKHWYSIVVVGRAKIDNATWDEVKSNLHEAIIHLNAKQSKSKC